MRRKGTFLERQRGDSPYGQDSAQASAYLERKSFTLVEVLVVMVVLGILAGIAVPAYIGVRQVIHDHGAEATLRLIQAAQESHRIETRQYIGCVSTANCNDLLRLDIPDGHWEYLVQVGAGDDTTTPPIPPTFCAQAQERNVANPRFWHIDQDDLEAARVACP